MSQEQLQDDLFRYLSENDILIVDTNSTARVSLAANLVQLGAKRNRMSLVGSMEEARAEIKRIRPKILFCDFMIGKESGLDLIQDQKLQYSAEIARETICILVTANGSQSTVAQAAEEDVDTFILKPYTMDSLSHSLTHAVLSKTRPSPYIQKVEQGKELMARGEIDPAIACFSEAMKLEPKPTLACFYLGQAELMRSALEDAKGKYLLGLAYSKIHYKCLVGLYELLIRQEKHAEAYDVVKNIAKYFPANPKRLSAVLRLAIVTSNFEDIENYYKIFTLLEQRTDELVKYICSAMSIAGKYFLLQNTVPRAVEVFDKVAATSAGRIQFLRYIVETLVEFRMSSEATQFLKRFPPELQGKEDYLVSKYIVANLTKPIGEVVQQGRSLIDQGIEQPVVYRILIESSMKAGFKDSAETLSQKASSKWPDQSHEFFRIVNPL